MDIKDKWLLLLIYFILKYCLVYLCAYLLSDFELYFERFPSFEDIAYLGIVFGFPIVLELIIFGSALLLFLKNIDSPSLLSFTLVVLVFVLELWYSSYIYTAEFIIIKLFFSISLFSIVVWITKK